MSGWTADDITDLSGKVAIVTGANSGLGFETVLALAGHGANVVLACRNLDKGRDAQSRILAAHPTALVELSELDLASLASIRSFVARFKTTHEKLDLLCNNAGIMAIPRRETEDGFEMQLGTNHLGHFALTGMLMDRLASGTKSRIVSVSSLFHATGKIRFDDIHSQRFYSKWLAYGQSKLANLLFAYELQRRLEAANSQVISVAAHPGYSNTNLQFAGTKAWSATFRVVNKVAQSPKMGALPTLYAATATNVHGGDFLGPDGIMELVGYPKKVKSSRRSRDRDDQRRFFELSEQLTGVQYAL